jgi:hypothetical protein
VADALRASLADFVAQAEPMWLHRPAENSRQAAGPR